MSNRHQNNLFITLESLINSNHPYRRLEQLIDFDKLVLPFNHIYPTKGAVFGDKGYGVNPANKILKQTPCHNATIQKNNMKHKNKDKDRWLSGIRSPDERVFAHRNKRLRYQGLAKAQFQVGARALVFNFKRLITLRITSME